MRRNCLRAVVCSCTLASLSIGPAPSSHASGAAITQVGWWSQRPGAGALPEGGFEIALAPNGPLSQAALRIRVDSVQLTSALLQLTESQAAGAEVAAITACLTHEGWSAANPGAWSDAPEPDCTRKEELSRSLSGEWSADISNLLDVGTVSIVLVPGSHPDTQGAPIPYQLVFEGATLSATAPATAAPPTLTPGSSGPGQSTTIAPEIVAAPGAPLAGFGPAAPPIVIATPSPDARIVAAPTLAPDLDEDGGISRQWWRLTILIPLSLLIGAGTVLLRRVLRERELLST